MQNLATVSDVALSYNWLWKIFNFGNITAEETNSILEYYGFTEMYEIGQKDKCWVYGNQMAEYKDRKALDSSSYNGNLLPIYF